MQINNEATPTLFKVQTEAKINLAEDKTKDGLYRVNILGYSGASVNLNDYGIEYPVVYKLSGIQLNKENIPYLLNHSSFHPLGHTEKVMNGTNLRALAVHSYPSQESKNVAGGIENGMPYEASMGLEIDVDSVTTHMEGAIEVNGRTFNAPIHVVHNATLVELSATLFGRDGDTSVTKLSKETLMRIRNNKPGESPAPAPVLPVQNAPVEPVTPVAPVAPVAPVVPVQNVPVAPVLPVNIPNSKTEAEDKKFERFMTLKKQYGKDHDPAETEDLLFNAVKNGWDDDRIKREFEIKSIENSWKPVPGVHLPGNKVENEFVAHFALSCGVRPEFLEAKLGKAVVEAAAEKPRLGLKESMMMVANANGGRFSGHSDEEALVKHMKRMHIQNTASTLDYSNLMHQVTKWTFEDAWLLDPPFAPSICAPVSNKDFRATGHIKPKGGVMWNGLNQEGKIEHTSFGKEDKYITELATIAQMLILKREDIINDDIGWIEQSLLLMKEGAWMYPDYQLVNLMYNAEEAGVLDTDEGFYDLPFNATNLEILHNFVKRRAVVKGDKIVNAKRQTKFKLIYASDLEKQVWEVLNQSNFVQGPDGIYVGQRNYWLDKFDPVMFDQLDNVTYNANAVAGAWGLLPVAPMFSPFAITYLRGKKMPTIEVVDLPADELGWGVRGYFDVNIDYRPVENNKLQATAFSFPSDES